MRAARRTVSLGLAAAVLVVAGPRSLSGASLGAPSTEVLEAHLRALGARFPARAAAVLEQIAESPRRLLAARAYLRAGLPRDSLASRPGRLSGLPRDSLASRRDGLLSGLPRDSLASRPDGRLSGQNLESRWSWSAQQIEAYARSAEYRALLAEIEQVRARFEQRNPGYSLYANTEPRSLEQQLARWNSNRSVGVTAQALFSDALVEMRRGRYTAQPDAGSLQRFDAFLVQWRPPTAAALAAPGLSRHGQSRAIDFQVVRDGVVIAGTEMASVRSIWEGQGWSKKLPAAASGTRFRGPLQSPYEPWHYEYDP